MIKNAEKIDYDIKSTPLSKAIADYKKEKALKERRRKKLPRKTKLSV